jgi:hypothetical protein
MCSIVFWDVAPCCAPVLQYQWLTRSCFSLLQGTLEVDCSIFLRNVDVHRRHQPDYAVSPNMGLTAILWTCIWQVLSLNLSSVSVKSAGQMLGKFDLSLGDVVYMLDKVALG